MGKKSHREAEAAEKNAGRLRPRAEPPGKSVIATDPAFGYNRTLNCRSDIFSVFSSTWALGHEAGKAVPAGFGSKPAHLLFNLPLSSLTD